MFPKSKILRLSNSVNNIFTLKCAVCLTPLYQMKDKVQETTYGHSLRVSGDILVDHCPKCYEKIRKAEAVLDQLASLIEMAKNISPESIEISITGEHEEDEEEDWEEDEDVPRKKAIGIPKVPKKKP